MADKEKKALISEENEFKWPYGPKNYMVLALALVVIIIGYITLAKGSITLAPILLVAGYCIIIPVALIVKDKRQKNVESDETA